MGNTVFQFFFFFVTHDMMKRPPSMIMLPLELVDVVYLPTKYCHLLRITNKNSIYFYESISVAMFYGFSTELHC